MKTALIFLTVAILILILILLWLRTDVWFTKSTVDIHFHDTYFVIHRPRLLLIVPLYLGTFFFLGGSIGTKFRSKIFLIVLLIFLVTDICIFWKVYSAFHH